MQNDFFFVFPEFQRGGIYAVPYSGDLVIRTNVFRSLVHLTLTYVGFKCRLTNPQLLLLESHHLMT